MNYISNNIKYLRKINNLRQEDLGDILECTRDNIASYERGTKPKIELIQRLVNHFHIGLNDFINTDLSLATNRETTTAFAYSNQKNEPSKSSEEKAIYNKKGNENIIVATQDQAGNSTVPMINIKAAANYLTGYQSQEYYETLDYLILPDWMARGKQNIFFQILGDSMEPTYYDSQWVQGSYVEKNDWQYIRDGEAYIILSNNRGFQLKRVKNRLREGFLRCRSDNRAHGPFNIPNDDLLQIWRVEGYYTRYMPNLNETLYNKIDFIEDQNTDLRLMYEDMLKNNTDLQRQLDELKKQLPPAKDQN